MMDHSFISGLIGVVLLLGTLATLYWVVERSRTIEHFKSSVFLKRIERGEIAEVTISGQDVRGKLTDGSRFTASIPDDKHVWDLLKAHNVSYDVQPVQSQTYHWYFIIFGTLLIGIIMMFYFMRYIRNAQGGGGAPGIFAHNKSKAKMFMPSTIKTRFADVAGADEAKEDLTDLVDYLKNPQKYSRLGAKIPKGILLVGPPGTGKTLLARAVAGEANVPFFSVTGSDFMELYVGVGAARVRDLFSQVRKHAPAILFIDEIDAVGRKRHESGSGSGNDERENTLNQLLAEMDGFSAMTNVIVIAATNRADVLDKALTRPGRFDKQIEVPLPDTKCRFDILKIHAQNVILNEAVDLEKVARGTTGFSGADLENLINEAALIATKLGHDAIMPQDFESARDKISLGKEIKTMIITDEDRKVTAYHEAGHALMVLLHPEDAEPLHQVSIIPRPGALGHTLRVPERDKYNQRKAEMIAAIRIACGGRAAEETVFGEVTTGAHSDFANATKIARAMVAAYGMSDEMGLVVYELTPFERGYSERTAEKVDQAVRTILDTHYKETKQLLEQHRDKLDKLATELEKKETMYSPEIYELLEIEPRVNPSLA